MGLNAKKVQGNKQGGQQEPLEPDVYRARLVQLIDLGLQAQKPYQGKEKPPVQEIMLTYELCEEFMKDEEGNDIEDKPRWISETLPFFGLYADKAKSTQRYKAFDPDEAWGGDFSQAIERPINVTVVNNAVGDKIYDNIATISPMRPKDAEKCSPLKNGAKVFDLDAPDITVFNSFPKWIQEKIQANLNYEGSPLQKLLKNAPAPKKEAPKKEEPKAEAEEGNNPY